MGQINRASPLPLYHQLYELLRGEIAVKVGGDTHFRSAHQPIRVPGTVYHKHGHQRLVQIREATEFEVDLAEMAERVADMPPIETPVPD